VVVLKGGIVALEEAKVALEGGIVALGCCCAIQPSSCAGSGRCAPSRATGLTTTAQPSRGGQSCVRGGCVCARGGGCVGGGYGETEGLVA